MEQHTKLSKFLSFVLRHRPDSIGVSMDSGGWVDIDELIAKSLQNGTILTWPIIKEIVASDAKGRYKISEDGKRIRANQGHSIEVDLNLKQAIPPIPLYHGTYVGAIKAIMQSGLKKMKRHHVHLSANREKAIEVGARHGKPVLLEIDVAQMVEDRIKFFITENGVWLTDEVPVKYLKVTTI